MKAEDYGLYSAHWLVAKLPDDHARAAFVEIGNGMRLAVPRDQSGPAELIPDHRFNPGFSRRAISDVAVAALLKSGLLAEMPEHRTDDKVGWREAGLPGEHFRIYACLQ